MLLLLVLKGYGEWVVLENLAGAIAMRGKHLTRAVAISRGMKPQSGRGRSKYSGLFSHPSVFSNLWNPPGSQTASEPWWYSQRGQPLKAQQRRERPRIELERTKENSQHPSYLTLQFFRNSCTFSFFQEEHFIKIWKIRKIWRSYYCFKLSHGEGFGEGSINRTYWGIIQVMAVRS